LSTEIDERSGDQAERIDREIEKKSREREKRKGEKRFVVELDGRDREVAFAQRDFKKM